MLNMSTVIVPANPLKVVHDWSDSIFQIFENRGKLISCLLHRVIIPQAMKL